MNNLKENTCVEFAQMDLIFLPFVADLSYTLSSLYGWQALRIL